MKEKIYVSIDENTKYITWFVKKNSKWIGHTYYMYDNYEVAVSDIIEISRVNGIEYEQENIGPDPFVIVGEDPIYDYRYDDNIIFQSDHKYSPLDEFIKLPYDIEIVLDLPDRLCNDAVYVPLPMHPVDDKCKAYINDPHTNKCYEILININTGELSEADEESNNGK